MVIRLSESPIPAQGSHPGPAQMHALHALQAGTARPGRPCVGWSQVVPCVGTVVSAWSQHFGPLTSSTPKLILCRSIERYNSFPFNMGHSKYIYSCMGAAPYQGSPGAPPPPRVKRPTASPPGATALPRRAARPRPSLDPRVLVQRTLSPAEGQ